MTEERKQFTPERLQKIKEDAAFFASCGGELTLQEWRRAHHQLTVAAARVLILMEQIEDEN